MPGSSQGIPLNATPNTGSVLPGPWMQEKKQQQNVGQLPRKLAYSLKKIWLEDYFLFEIVPFLGDMLVFGE